MTCLYKKVLRSLDRIYETDKLFNITINSVATESGIAKGTLYTKFASNNDFYILLLNRNLIRWGIAGHQYATCSSLNPKEQILAQLTFTSSKYDYAKIDHDIQYFVSSNGLLDNVSHQYVYETMLVFKMLTSLNKNFVSTLVNAGHVNSDIQSTTTVLNNIKLYERGYSFNYNNDVIKMPLNEDKDDFYNFIISLINSLDWAHQFNIDLDKVKKHCKEKSLEIMNEICYFDEIEKLKSLSQ